MSARWRSAPAAPAASARAPCQVTAPRASLFLSSIPNAAAAAAKRKSSEAAPSATSRSVAATDSSCAASAPGRL